RTLYGYNAFFGAVLLLTILFVVNVMAYVPFWPFSYANATYDWTESTIYTLSPGSRELLASLDKPVKVYVLLPSGDEFVLREMRTLLDNCKAINPKLEVEYLSRDLNPEAVIKLEQDYQIPELQGVLIVYGPQGDQQSEFIKYDDIFSVERSRPGSDVKP